MNDEWSSYAAALAALLEGSDDCVDHMHCPECRSYAVLWAGRVAGLAGSDATLDTAHLIRLAGPAGPLPARVCRLVAGRQGPIWRPLP